MNNGSDIYGLTRIDHGFLIARVSHDGARPIVKSIQQFDSLENCEFDVGRIFFSVGNGIAQIKKLKIKQSSLFNASAIAQFEMSQCLLEPENEFYFDNLPLESDNGFQQFLTIAYRRHVVDELIEECEKKIRRPSGFKLDAVALTAGYLTFCRIEPGDLQALINIESDIITVAYIYKRKLQAIDYLKAEIHDDMSVELARKLAGELRMALSYQQNELFNDGVTIPLSRLIVCGGCARDEIIISAIDEQMAMELTLPKFHEGYFQSLPDNEKSFPLEMYLIPLGLAVE
ncbi:MAG: hypothetical protein V3V99_04730 [candidate division Zixibacteria bacterium]